MHKAPDGGDILGPPAHKQGMTELCGVGRNRFGQRLETFASPIRMEPARQPGPMSCARLCRAPMF